MYISMRRRRRAKNVQVEVEKLKSWFGCVREMEEEGGLGRPV